MPTLCSKTLTTPFKTVYIDLKDSSSGRFVQLASYGQFARQTITIDAADLPAVLETLFEFAGAAGIELPSQFKPANLSVIQREFPRAYKPWTNKEIRFLTEEVAEGKSLDEMARFHKRQPSAILSRIRTLSPQRQAAPLASSA
ncbi:MAG: hypothetical protein JNK63_10065 [Chthonomonas sp.]|nr:hypothetical protein [Chthonomonas sp.]